MRFTRRLAVVLTMILGSVMLLGSSAQAAYYNEYYDVASTPDYGSCPDSNCTGAQGFAAGSTYLYSVKTSTGDGDKASVIYRSTKAHGSSATKMKNGDTGKYYNTWLKHANDMTIMDIEGEHYFFVVTNSSSGAQVVKLRYSGTTYYYAGKFTVDLDGTTVSVSGINRISVDSSHAKFLFKEGRRVYNGQVPIHWSSGAIHLTTAFDLKVDGALVNGSPVSDLTTFSNQGFFYDETKKVLYYPLTKDNRSIVLVYRNVSPSTTGTVTSASDLSFRITSSKYSSKFEIEGVGLSGGKLFFNTNRANSTGAYDGIHEFKDYVAA